MKYLVLVLFMPSICFLCQKMNIDLNEEEKNLKGNIEYVEYFDVINDSIKHSKTIYFNEFNREIRRFPLVQRDAIKIIDYEYRVDTIKKIFTKIINYQKKEWDDKTNNYYYINKKDSIKYITREKLVDKLTWKDGKTIPESMSYFMLDSLDNVLLETNFYGQNINSLNQNFTFGYTRIHNYFYEKNAYELISYNYYFSEIPYISSSVITLNKNKDIKSNKANIYSILDGYKKEINSYFTYEYDHKGNWIVKNYMKEENGRILSCKLPIFVTNVKVRFLFGFVRVFNISI